MHSRWARISIPFAALVLVATACGGGGTSVPSAAGPTVAAASAAAPTGTPAVVATASETTPASASTAPAASESTAPAASESAAPGASESPAITPAPTQLLVQPSDVPAGAVVVRWFCCLGTGDDPGLVEKETAAVDAFNASHDKVKLALEINPYDGARDALANEIANNNAPDIVAPLGVGGANAFNDQWLDLAPLIAKTHYDLGQYQAGAVDFYKIGKQQTAVPFAIYPSSMFYKKTLFTEIGLSEPPHKYGEKYTITGPVAAAAFGVAEGTQVDWTYDTVRKLALLLTVDANNKDATQDGFDPTQIKQYGFEPQRDDLRGWGAYFGAGQLLAPDNKTVQVPDAWSASWKWLYDGTWKDHFIMTDSVYKSDEFGKGSYSFCSGHVAMEVNFLWSKYCLVTAGDDWDLAAVPAYKGDPSAAFNADTFRIMKSSKNPDAAFEAMTWLEGEGSKALLEAYGGMPARPAEQEGFFKAIDDAFKTPATDACKTCGTHPDPIDWQVARDSVQWADNPNFEAFMPAYNQSFDILQKYRSKWTTTDGLNMDTEIGALTQELQAAWAAANYK